MPNFIGNQKKASSDSKRHFTLIMGNKEHGLYISSTPSSAAKKAATKLCASNKGEKVEFSLGEITQGSKKKVYGPYIGYIDKLKDSGKIVVKKKSIIKKRGMKGGEGIDDIQVDIGDCGRRNKYSLNLFKKCIVLSYNNRKVTINYDEKQIVVKYFNKIDTNVYYKKENYSVTKTDLPIFSVFIIKELLNQPEVFLDESQCRSLINRIKKRINVIPNASLEFKMINNWLDKILNNTEKSAWEMFGDIQPKQNKNQVNREIERKYQENLETQRKYQENLKRADQTIAKQRANNERKRIKDTLLYLSQWEPTSGFDQGSGLDHRTNYSKQPTYQSYTLRENTH